jgi:hypothetical protein
MSSKIKLRSNPPTIYKDLSNFDNNFVDDENDNDIIDKTKKLKFMNKYSHLSINNTMYLVQIYIHEQKKIAFKVGYTNQPLISRLKTLNAQYGCGYNMILIDYFSVVSINDEKKFHQKNKYISDNYISNMGKRYREIYVDERIIDNFKNYKNKFLDIN